jgi:hypothetical protein
LTCLPNHDRCTACEKCESDGTCKNLKCKEKCCNHRCIPKNACCKHADCGDCGKCENRRCKNDPAKIGRKCGSGGCQVCTSRGCDKQIDNAGCFDRNGLCCDGVCCAPGQSCCGHVCCQDGFCVNGGCCAPGSGFAAAGDLCCPFGPPCGEGTNACCCAEGEECCRGECKRPEDCCPEENACGNDCCDQATGEICTSDGCCSFEAGEVPCGFGGDLATDAVCCGGHEQCCTFGVDLQFCCPAADTCCFGDCCAPGLECNGDCFHQTGRGCCPPNYPELGGCGVCEAATPGRTAPN